jgi:hypothetical protein
MKKISYTKVIDAIYNSDLGVTEHSEISKKHFMFYLRDGTIVEVLLKGRGR